MNSRFSKSGSLSSSRVNATQLILSVDDEPAILLTRQQILEDMGYEVLSACDGEQALHQFSNQPVNLVLLDYLMPRKDGGVVAREMKQRKPSVPIILVSASPIPAETLGYVDHRIDKGQGVACCWRRSASFSRHRQFEVKCRSLLRLLLANRRENLGTIEEASDRTGED